MSDQTDATPAKIIPVSASDLHAAPTKPVNADSTKEEAATEASAPVDPSTDKEIETPDAPITDDAAAQAAVTALAEAEAGLTKSEPDEAIETEAKPDEKSDETTSEAPAEEKPADVLGDPEEEPSEDKPDPDAPADDKSPDDDSKTITDEVKPDASPTTLPVDSKPTVDEAEEPHINTTELPKPPPGPPIEPLSQDEVKAALDSPDAPPPAITPDTPVPSPTPPTPPETAAATATGTPATPVTHPKARHPATLVIAIIAVLAIAIGAVVLILMHHSSTASANPTTAPKATPVAVSQIGQQTDSVDKSLSSVDSSMSDVNSGLNDKQGDLSE